jgi:hypothetical protein
MEVGVSKYAYADPHSNPSMRILIGSNSENWIAYKYLLHEILLQPLHDPIPLPKIDSQLICQRQKIPFLN